MHTDMTHGFETLFALVKAEHDSLRSEIRAKVTPTPQSVHRTRHPSPTITLAAEPYRDLRAKRDRSRLKAATEKMIYMTWASYKFPIGILSVKRSLKVFIRPFDNRSYEDDITFSLHAPKWLTSRVVEVSFMIRSCELKTTSFHWSISSAVWNDNASLERYAFCCNIVGLKRLFGGKEARPTDFLPSGRALIHLFWLVSQDSLIPCLLCNF
ncbi:hypothetical protein BJX96DRAFT_116010 [Aspergillus floccosus]